MLESDKPSVLLIDDDKTILDAVRDILEDAGYEVEAMSKGAEAIQALNRRSFNIVIVDFQLPDTTGLELARNVRERQNETQVILMTGHASLEMAVKAIQEAVYDYLIKPVDPSQLKRTISKALEQQKLALENRRLMEKMTRLDALKSRMLKILSHDLKTPLSSIRGYSELLKSGVKGKLTDAQKKMLEITIQESDHLNGLIGDLLDLAHIEAGDFNLDRRRIACGHMLDKAVQRIKLISEMKEVPVEVIISSELPEIFIDVPRMVQVISNLIRGALKHSSRGGRVFLNVIQKKDAIDLRISYVGMGFSPELLSVMFGPVGQMNMEPSDSLDGMRIMLALAREVLHAHGGDLGVDSKGRDQGATFWMVLPITAETSDVPAGDQKE
jgi:two-component system sensor histidine kinase/response regulator